MTYDIIKPIYDSRHNIVDWRIVARVVANDVASALNFGRKEYGQDVDVREVK